MPTKYASFICFFLVKIFTENLLMGFVFVLSFSPSQDKKDDKVVGVKSTALLFGENTKVLAKK